MTGTTQVYGDTGISAAIEDELASIVGQTRIILLYDTVSGQGANAVYNVVGFAGARIMAVELNGNSKHLAIQPAYVVSNEAITGEQQTSYFVSQSPRLSR